MQVLCIGPTGTGKTLTIANKLLRHLPRQYTPEFIVFSAKTSSNQTQDLIDGKLDKRLAQHFSCVGSSVTVGERWFIAMLKTNCSLYTCSSL